MKYIIIGIIGVSVGLLILESNKITAQNATDKRFLALEKEVKELKEIVKESYKK